MPIEDLASLLEQDAQDELATGEARLEALASLLDADDGEEPIGVDALEALAEELGCDPIPSCDEANEQHSCSSGGEDDTQAIEESSFSLAVFTQHARTFKRNVDHFLECTRNASSSPSVGAGLAVYTAAKQSLLDAIPDACTTALRIRGRAPNCTDLESLNSIFAERSHLQSKAVRASIAGMKPKRCDGLVNLSSCLAWILAEAKFKVFLQKVATYVRQQGGRIISATEVFRADESSMPVRVVEKFREHERVSCKASRELAIAPPGSIAKSTTEFVGGPTKVGYPQALPDGITEHHRPCDTSVGNVGSEHVQASVDNPDFERIKEERKSHRRTVGRFARTEFLGEIVAIRQVMEPWRIYISDFLRLHADSAKASEFEQQNLSEGHVPMFPVFRAARGELEGPLVQSIEYRLLGSSGAYDTVPLHQRTEELSCLLFRMLSSSGCMARNLRNRRMNFPNKYIAGVLNLDELRDMTTNRKHRCRFDAWTEKVVDFYADGFPGNINDLVNDLFCTAALLEEETSFQERHWSHLRKRLNRQHGSTWHTSAEDLNCNHIRSFFQRQAKEEQRHKVPHTTGSSSLDGSSGETESFAGDGASQDLVTKVEQPLRKKPKLGLFQAWFGANSHGSSGSPSMQDSWVAFKSFTLEQRREAKQIQESTNDARQLRQLPAYGAKSRDVQRSVARCFSSCEVASQVLSNCAAKTSLELDAFHILEEYRLPREAPARIADLPGRKLVLQQEARAEVKRSLVATNTWASFQRSAGAREACDTVARLALNPEKFRAEFVPFPQTWGLHHAHFQWFPSTLLDEAIKIVAIPPGNRGHVVNLRRALEVVWQQANQNTPHTPQPEVDTKPKHRLCHMAHKHVCGTEHIALRRFYQNLQFIVKTQLKDNAAQKWNFDHGFIVYLFIGSPPGIDYATVSLCLHAGDVELSPFQVHYQLLEAQDLDLTLTDEGALSYDGIIQLTSELEFRGPWEAMDAFQLDFRWHVCFLKLLARKNLMVEIAPWKQNATVLFGGQTFQVFDPSQVSKSATETHDDQFAALHDALQNGLSDNEDDLECLVSQVEDEIQAEERSRLEKQVEKESSDSDSGTDDSSSGEGCPIANQRRIVNRPGALASLRLPDYYGDCSITAYKSGEIYAIYCAEDSSVHRVSRSMNKRPLGFLMCWLMDAESCDDPHSDLKTFPYRSRALARAMLQELPGSEDLFECERAQRDDEDEEPNQCP